MGHGQIGEGFQGPSELAERPTLPQQRPRQAQHRPRGGGERPNQIEEIRLRSIGLINHLRTTHTYVPPSRGRSTKRSVSDERHEICSSVLLGLQSGPTFM